MSILPRIRQRCPPYHGDSSTTLHTGSTWRAFNPHKVQAYPRPLKIERLQVMSRHQYFFKECPQVRLPYRRVWEPLSGFPCGPPEATFQPLGSKVCPISQRESESRTKKFLSKHPPCLFLFTYKLFIGLLRWLSGKELACQGETGVIPGSERSPGDRKRVV